MLCICRQGQAKLADHVRRSYSVGDVSAVNQMQFVDGEERDELSDDDDEIDNRRIADQYNREVAEMTAAASDSRQLPALYHGQRLLESLQIVCCHFVEPLANL